MAILSAKDLAYTQNAVQLYLMDRTATIIRKTLTPDGAGGTINTWTAVVQSNGLTTVPCMVDEPATKSVEVVVANRIEAVNPYDIYLPLGTDVIEKDRVQVDNHTYEIRGVQADEETFATWVSIDALEIR